MTELDQLRNALAKLYTGADENWPAFERILQPVQFDAGALLSQEGKRTVIKNGTTGLHPARC